MKSLKDFLKEEVATGASTTGFATPLNTMGMGNIGVFNNCPSEPLIGKTAKLPRKSLKKKKYKLEDYKIK